MDSALYRVFLASRPVRRLDFALGEGAEVPDSGDVPSLHAACAGLEEGTAEQELVEAEMEAGTALPKEKSVAYQECAAQLVKSLRALGVGTLVVDDFLVPDPEAG